MVEAKSADDGGVLSIGFIQTNVKNWGYPWQLELMPLPLQGDWSGTLQMPLPLVFRLAADGTGVALRFNLKIWASCFQQFVAF
jgi:hypothetical protein